MPSRARPLKRRTNPIDYIFVLMLENRSFDHFLGGLPGVDGADESRFNLDKDGTRYYQLPGAHQVMSPDPKHEYPHVLTQLDPPGGLGSMGGFALDYSMSHPETDTLQRAEIMAYFQDGKLAALHTLAKEFVVCQTWHASVPGPTWTNRFFAHSGTSAGIVAMPEPPFDWNLHRYAQTTIYDRLDERNVPWRIYYGDVPQSVLLAHQRRPSNLRRYRKMKHFREDVAEGAPGLPNYIFIEPSYFGNGQNDDHPPANVNRGQALVAEVYGAIRANEDVWMRSLLVVTYDEHGGFYDHAVPEGAMPPDDDRREYAFDRYGVRVPALLVSPWVTRGGIDSTQYDHTSILRFAQRRWGLGALGNRTASAQSFEHQLLATPRRDTPKSIPFSAIGPAGRVMATRGVEPIRVELNKNQRALIAFGDYLDAHAPDTPEMKGQRLSRTVLSEESRIAVTLERYERLLGGGAGK